MARSEACRDGWPPGRARTMPCVRWRSRHALSGLALTPALGRRSNLERVTSSTRKDRRSSLPAFVHAVLRHRLRNFAIFGANYQKWLATITGGLGVPSTTVTSSTT